MPTYVFCLFECAVIGALKIFEILNFEETMRVLVMYSSGFSDVFLGLVGM